MMQYTIGQDLSNTEICENELNGWNLTFPTLKITFRAIHQIRLFTVH